MRLFIILFLFIASSFATNLPHIYVFHINGIGTTRDEAIDNAKALQATMTIHTNLVADYEVKYLYNPTYGAFFDILDDLMVQKSKENQVMSLDDYVQVYMQDNHLSYPVGSAMYNTLKNNMTPLYTKELKEASGTDIDYLIQQFHNQVPAQTPVQFADIRNILYNDANAYAIFIPHSQGNLYANSLYEYLSSVEKFDAKKMMILGIGSPAQDIKGSQSNYITASNDYVIGSSRLLYSNTLPSNHTLNTSNDILNHSLINAYLYDSATFKLISSFLNDKIASFSNNILDFNLDTTLKAKLTGYYITEIVDPYGTPVCFFDTCNDKVAYYDYNGYPIFAFADSDMVAGAYKIYTEVSTPLANIKSFSSLGASSSDASVNMQSRTPLILGIDRPNCTKLVDEDGNPIMNENGTQKADCVMVRYEKSSYTNFDYFLPFHIDDFDYYSTNLPVMFNDNMVLIGDFAG